MSSLTAAAVAGKSTGPRSLEQPRLPVLNFRRPCVSMRARLVWIAAAARQKRALGKYSSRIGSVKSLALRQRITENCSARSIAAPGCATTRIQHSYDDAYRAMNKTHATTTKLSGDSELSRAQRNNEDGSRHDPMIILRRIPGKKTSELTLRRCWYKSRSSMTSRSSGSDPSFRLSRPSNSSFSSSLSAVGDPADSDLLSPFISLRRLPSSRPRKSAVYITSERAAMPAKMKRTATGTRERQTVGRKKAVRLHV